MSVASIVLCAGASQRMGCPKALLTWTDGVTLLEWQCRVLASLGPVVVVTSRPLEDRVVALDLPDIALVFNHQPERGMFSSVLLGLQAFPCEVDGFLVLPVDCPLEDAGVPGILCRKAQAGEDPWVLIPTYRGQRGHPVWLSWRVAKGLCGESPEGSLRESLGRYPVVEVPVDVPAVLANLNTPDDVHHWRTDRREGR